MAEPENEPEPFTIASRLVYDPSARVWFCEVGDPGAEAGGSDVQGSGPDPLTAAMNAAERATVQYWALRDPQAHAKYLDASAGWVELDADGFMIRETTEATSG